MPGLTQIVSLADAEAELNMTATPSDGGTKLQGFIDAASVVIEDIVGPVIGRTTTEIHDGGDVSIFLWHAPVISIASIVETIGFTNYTLTAQPVGSPTDNYGYTLDDARVGRITRRSAGSTPVTFYANTGNVSITYSYGRTSLAIADGFDGPNIRLATLKLIRHMWAQEQGNRPAFGEPAAEPMSKTPSGFIVPNAVKELCQPSLRDPVFS
jgi:hypothetical protein